MYYPGREGSRALSRSAGSSGPSIWSRSSSATSTRELDMLIEAGSIEKFARNFEEGGRDLHPQGLLGFHDRIGPRRWSTSRASRWTRWRRSARHGIDPKEIALIGLRAFSRQLMEFGFFHADPHPGNTIVMSDGRVSLVDFGITGYLDEETMRQIANLFLGYAEHDYDLVMDALMERRADKRGHGPHRPFRSDLEGRQRIVLRPVAAAHIGKGRVRPGDGARLQHHIRLPQTCCSS